MVGILWGQMKFAVERKQEKHIEFKFILNDQEYQESLSESSSSESAAETPKPPAAASPASGPESEVAAGAGDLTVNLAVWKGQTTWINNQPL